MLGAMGLKGEDVFKRVSQLSGGEKARLKLADATRSVLETGLNLIGVSAPEKM